MNKVFLLAMASIRKSKGQALGMVALMLASVLLLNVGLVMYFGVGDFFDERAEELNTAHFAALKSEFAPSDAQIYFMQQYPGVIELETQSIIAGAGGFYSDGAQSFGIILIASGMDDQKMNPPKLIGESAPLVGNAIYVPHPIFLNDNYRVGDDFKLNLLGTEIDFVIAGSTEEILFGALNEPFWRFYVSGVMFQELQEAFPIGRVTLLSARMEDIDDAVFLYANYINEFFGTGYNSFPALTAFEGLFPMTYDLARQERTIIPMIVAAFLTGFSIILLVVGMIITRFRINNSIEEGMTNIGILKAIGYRNYQIIVSIMVQFGLIVLVGGALGAASSRIALPALIQVTESMLGLPWIPDFNAPIIILSILSVLFATLLISLASSGRINKLYPIAALRGGVTAHSFKKNPMPLEKFTIPLALQLALKQLLQGKKQAVMVSLIIVGVTFASVAGLATHYNMSVDMEAFVHTIAGDNPDITFELNSPDAGPGFMERVSAHPDVENVFPMQGVMLSVDDVVVLTTVVDDFSNLDGHSIIRGRFPLHDNEIALSTPALTTMGKEMGDWVIITSDGGEYEYLVTGVAQSIRFNGFVAMLSVDGLTRTQPGFAFSTFSADLLDGVDSTGFMESIVRVESDVLLNVVSIHDIVNAQLSMIGDIFAIVNSIILSVVAAVVILVLYMVIKTTILRRKRDLGIQKALGFTTLQLMNQIALNLTPTIFIGVGAGAISGYFSFNPLFVALLRGMGIAQANMTIPVEWIITLCLALVLLSYAVSMLISWRIRKISAYTLVTE